MITVPRVATALICLALSQLSAADTIHAIQGGGYYHHQSGWVFPGKIGDFALAGTTPESIKATPVSVEISKKPRLRAAKLTYKDGKNSRATVYFVDAGAWIVRIRTSVPATDKATAPALETFVRSQRWDSLQPAT
jgi:hypothetical protein